MNQKVEDPIVLKVMSLTRTDLNLIDWLTHLQEEMMDAALYCERLKDEVKQFKQG